MSNLNDVRLALVLCASALCGVATAQQPNTNPPPAPPTSPPPATTQPATPEKAEESKPDAPQAAPPPREIEWIIKQPNELGFSAGFENQPGGVAVSRMGADLEVDIPVGPMGELDLGVAYEYSRYDFSSSSALIPGVRSPFENIHKETLRASFGKQETRQLGWIVGGSVGFAAEDGGELGKAVVGSAFGGVGYYLSEHLKVGAALAVYSRLGKDPLILPVPTLNWEIDERWKLSTAGKPGLTLSYKPSEAWTVGLGAWYESRTFRLDQSGPVPGGIGRDSAVPVLLNAVFKPTKNLTMEAGLGVKVFQNISIDDSSGNTLADVNSDAAPFLSLRVGLTF